MASSTITSRKTEGEKIEAVKDFVFLGSRITADGHFSHEIKRPLLLGKLHRPRCIKKVNTLPTKVHIIKVMVFPVVLSRCESWTIKASEWKSWCFKLCWRRVPWTGRRSNQSILKERKREVTSFSCVQLFVTPWTVPCQVPSSMEFFRQGYWSGLPFPSSGGFSWPRDRTWVSHTASRLYLLSRQRSPSKGNQPSIFIGRTDAEAPVFWPPDA